MDALSFTARAGGRDGSPRAERLRQFDDGRDHGPADGRRGPGVVRAVSLSGVHLAPVALAGLGAGTLHRHPAPGTRHPAPGTRHPASAVGVLVGLLFVVPAVLAGLTGVRVARWYPTVIAGTSPAIVKPVDESPTPSAPLGMLYLYAAVVLGATAGLPVRRDA